VPVEQSITMKERPPPTGKGQRWPRIAAACRLFGNKPVFEPRGGKCSIRSPGKVRKNIFEKKRDHEKDL